MIAFRDAAEFEAWLDAHVDLRAGVWLKIAKRGSGVASLTDDEAVDVGLCYGWISGQRKSCNEVYYLQKYVPRRPGSRWSQVNVAKVGELIAAGRMQPSGLAEVEAAKGDGRWAAAYASQRDANKVDPVSTSTDTIGEPIRVARDAAGIVISPDGKTAYVAETTWWFPCSGLAGKPVPSYVVPIRTATNTAGKPIWAGLGVTTIATAPL